MSRRRYWANVGAGLVLVGLLLFEVLAPIVNDWRPVEIAPRPAVHPLSDLIAARAAGDSVALGNAWLRMGADARAAEVWSGADAQAHDATTLRRMAELALQSGQWADARSAYTHIVALDPFDTQAHLNLGLMLAAVNPVMAHAHLQAAEAEPELAPLARAAREASTQSAEAVGWALFEAEQWPFAELAFSVAAAETNPRPTMLAALALTQDYQDRDGSRWMAKALEAAPEEAPVLALAGMHLRLRGDLEGSLMAFTAAAELAPESAPLLAQVGVAYQRAGNLEQARDWLERAVALGGDDERYQALLDAVADTEEAAFDALVDALDSGAAYGAP